MKITKTELKKIIKEEYAAALGETGAVTGKPVVAEENDADFTWVPDFPNIFYLRHRRLGNVGSVELQDAKWLVFDEDGQRPLAKERTLDRAKDALLYHLDIDDSDVNG